MAEAPLLGGDKGAFGEDGEEAKTESPRGKSRRAILRGGWCENFTVTTCVAYTCGVVIGIYLLALFGNVIFYWVCTFGCGPKLIGDNYPYPGGGTGPNGGPTFNLLPKVSILAERDHSMWGWPMDVMPGNEAGTVAGAQVGTWWRNKGWIFSSYLYEDIQESKKTLYMRPNFWLPWMSYKLARCDGKGPVFTFSENGHWMQNKMRSWFRMNQAQTYGIWMDGEQVARVDEVSSGYPSLTITNTTLGKDGGTPEVASSILTRRNLHHRFDMWLAKNKAIDSMPFFVNSAITVPFAFSEIDAKIAKAGAKADYAAKQQQQAANDQGPPGHYLDAAFLTQQPDGRDAATKQTEAEVLLAGNSSRAKDEQERAEARKKENAAWIADERARDAARAKDEQERAAARAKDEQERKEARQKDEEERKKDEEKRKEAQNKTRKDDSHTQEHV